jgi:hypothetical protein
VGGGKEIPRGFVVAGCDRPELLEFAEESLDQVALFVKFSIEFARRQAVGSGRDCGGIASRCQRVEDSAIGIEGAICDLYGSSAPAAAKSCARPGVSRKRRGLPSASTRAWILVLRPPRLRPRAFYKADSA